MSHGSSKKPKIKSKIKFIFKIIKVGKLWKNQN